MHKKYVTLGFITAVIAMITDQVTKYWALQNLGYGKHITVMPSFNLVLAWNKGVSWGMFNSGTQMSILILTFIAISVVVMLGVWMVKSKDLLLNLALGGIIGGAIGNVIDRIRFGAVVDFLDVYWKTHHWPTFNLADSYICVGVAIILFKSLTEKRHV